MPTSVTASLQDGTSWHMAPRSPAAAQARAVSGCPEADPSAGCKASRSMAHATGMTSDASLVGASAGPRGGSPASYSATTPPHSPTANERRSTATALASTSACEGEG